MAAWASSPGRTRVSALADSPQGLPWSGAIRSAQQREAMYYPLQRPW
ncbi:hypothetical protein ACIKP9_07055 [Methylobacillus methanolivorans]|uniref:Uncharacterized protein n=1 Tax=Methylobacillus methanolivorans TaxID=1848927 RepID=A0ABW8GPU7_9PROT